MFTGLDLNPLQTHPADTDGTKMFNALRSLFSRPTVTFQIMSDLHLEISQQYSSFDIPVAARYLILAGDVGRLVDYDAYVTFLQKQTDRFELVFLVLGNHEFHGTSFSAGLEDAKCLERKPCLNGKLVLLHRAKYHIPNTRVMILGCTLWSSIPENAREVVNYKIQDFQKIEDWSVDRHNESHEDR